jgi:hypothetical protein
VQILASLASAQFADVMGRRSFDSTSGAAMKTPQKSQPSLYNTMCEVGSNLAQGKDANDPADRFSLVCEATKVVFNYSPARCVAFWQLDPSSFV